MFLSGVECRDALWWSYSHFWWHGLANTIISTSEWCLCSIFLQWVTRSLQEKWFTRKCLESPEAFAGRCWQLVEEAVCHPQAVWTTRQLEYGRFRFVGARSCVFMYVLMKREKQLSNLIHLRVGKLKAFLVFKCRHFESALTNTHRHPLK